MTTLFIDTSSTYLNVSIIKDDELYEKHIECIKEHSKHTIRLIEELFNENNIKPIDIDSIMVINGPGSFTGLRIGVTIAKIYAWSYNIKLIPISTLKAYAISNSNSDYYVSVIDARRSFVYAGIYDGNYNNIIEDQYIKIEDLYDLIKNKNPLLLGNINIKDIEAKKVRINVMKLYNYYKDNTGINSHKLVPDYLKKVEAEEKLEGKND